MLQVLIDPLKGNNEGKEEVVLNKTPEFLKNSRLENKIKLSFESTKGEMEAQRQDLPNYVSYLDSLNLRPPDPDKAIFVGAGDSLAACGFVERLFDFAPKSLDPYDLIQYPELARNKSVFILSISGRTKANVEAAWASAKLSKEIIAITTNENSDLAKVSSRVVPLKFTKFPGLTPGTNSFTISMLAACAILGKTPYQPDFTRIMALAQKERYGSGEPPRARHFVGSGKYYPLAMYGYAKNCEVLGGPGDYQLVEEFSHMNLFSLQGNDCVVILPNGEGDLRSQNLHARLVEAGVNSLLLDFDSAYDKITQGIYYAVQLQYFALSLAQRKGLRQPAFLEKKKFLEISDKLIY
ncbi:MAG: hypothetical protein OK457_03810 [Thaumarchaeota archaeon]|nr:hypothetical protein [Nitrososphaerota archaeon]